jgi:predicted DsbA family dithiol-disulfide isomerase
LRIKEKMKVEFWADVVCPWCYIGKRRFEAALAKFEHRDQVEVVWRSFQLDPNTSRDYDLPVNEHLARKYGMSIDQAADRCRQVSELAAQEGLEYHLDRAKYRNTFDAHRLVHLAASQGRQAEMQERLMRAYFTEAADLGNTETLVRLASEVGVNPREARAVLLGDAYADAVRADEQRARELGITSVPFVAIDEKVGVSGAQPEEAFREALEQAFADPSPPSPLPQGERGVSAAN